MLNVTLQDIENFFFYNELFMNCHIKMCIPFLFVKVGLISLTFLRRSALLGRSLS